MLNQAQLAAVRQIVRRGVLDSVRPASAHSGAEVLRVTAGSYSWIVKLSGHEAADPRRARPMGFLPGLVGALFVDGLGNDLAARVIGADVDSEVLVLEDLGTGADLADLLIAGDAEAARRAMRELAALLGRLHASTANREPEYERLWRQYWTDWPSPQPGWRFASSTASLRQMAQQLDLRVAPSVEGDLQVVAGALEDPFFRTYVHGDPCPDKVRPGEGGRLIDFEAGGYGLALLDAVYARMPFPTCWCTGRLPDTVVADFERTYRAELARGLPAAADDRRFERALVAACGYWFVVHANWRLIQGLDAAAEPAHTQRGLLLPDQRAHVLLRAESFIAAARAYGHLEALAELAAQIVTRLRLRQPLRGVLRYPAFR